MQINHVGARVAIGTAALIALLLSAEPGIGQRLSPATHRATFTQVFVPWEIYPIWAGPFLFKWRYATTAEDTGENLFFYRRNGQIGAKLRLWFPDVYKVTILSATGSSRSGQVVVIGRAWENSGLIAGFFGQISANGRIMRVVQTSPFEPKAVVFAPDDSIWLAGVQVGPLRDLRTAPEHAMVQRYGTDGKLLGEFLARSTWQCPGQPHPLGISPLLVASGNRIGVISNGCWEWAQLTSEGEFVARRPLPPVPGHNSSVQRIMAAAMTSTGLYARFDTPGLYRLAADGTAWQPVEVSQPGDPVTRPAILLGAEGDALVLHSGYGRVFWANVIETSEHAGN